MTACCSNLHLQSIKFHENGKRHQEAVRDYLVAQRNNKEAAATSASNLATTMAQIEAAARAAMETDIASGAFSGGMLPDVSPHVIAASAPPSVTRPPSTHIGPAAPPTGFLAKSATAATPAHPHAPYGGRPVATGANSSRLEPRAQLPPVVAPVPGSAVGSSSCSSMGGAPPPPPPPPDDDEEESESEDKLTNQPSVPAGVDETTGYGEWQTVVVRDVVPRQPKAASDSASTSSSAGSKRPRPASNDIPITVEPKPKRGDFKDVPTDTADAGLDDAYSFFNPYGGAYRGYKLDDNDAAPHDTHDHRDGGYDSVAEGAHAPSGAEGVPSATAPPHALGTVDAVATARVPVVEFKKRGLKPGQQLRKRRGDDD